MRPPRSENSTDFRSAEQVPFTSHAGDAARALLSAIERHGEGIWKLHPASSETSVLSIEVNDDLVIDLERPGRRSLLHRALLRDSLLKKRDLERLERRGLEEKRCPGILCLEEGILEPLAAAESIAAEISTDLLEVFTGEEGCWCGPFQQGIDSGMRGRVEVGLSPQQALLRSARQNGKWELIGEMPLLREVLAAGPSAFALVQQEDTSAEVRSLLEAADGQKDLFDLTRHRADPWRAFDRALELLEGGHLQTLSAIQLFQLGELKLASNDPESALRHWRRAEEKGLDDFDLCGRIGEICARSDRRQEAVSRLRQHARKSTEQLRFEAARQAWTELVCLDPADEEAIDRSVQFWIKEPGTDLSSCLRLAESLKAGGRWSEIAELVSGVGVRQPDARLHEWHGEAARALGDEEMELKALWRRAECLRTGSDPVSSLPHYQELLNRSYQVGKVSLRLAEMQLQQGEVSAARESLKPVLKGKLRSVLHDCEESQGILQSCSRQDSVPLEVFDVLCEIETDRGQKSAARQYLIQMLNQYRGGTEGLLIGYRVKTWLAENTEDVSLLEEWLNKVVAHSGNSEVLTTIEFALNHMDLNAEDRVRLALRGLESDPSQPSYLEVLLASEDANPGEKSEWYRRISLRSVADGLPIPAPGDVQVSEEFAWRTPLLKLTCQQQALSRAVLESIGKSVLNDADYLRQLLMDHAQKETGVGEQLSSMSTPVATPASSGRAAVVRSGIGGITEKLKNFHGEPPASRDAVVESDGASSEEPVETASASGGEANGIQSALDRLKALRNPSAASNEAGEPEKSDKDRQEVPTSLEERKPPASTSQPKVNAAIARLGALRNGGNLATGVDVERRDP